MERNSVFLLIFYLIYFLKVIVFKSNRISNSLRIYIKTVDRTLFSLTFSNISVFIYFVYICTLYVFVKYKIVFNKNVSFPPVNLTSLPTELFRHIKVVIYNFLNFFIFRINQINIVIFH